MSKLTVRMLITWQFFGFLKSDNARTAPSKTAALEATAVVKQIRDSMERDSAAQAEATIQATQYTSASIVLAAFFPISICTSVCYQLSMIGVFSDKKSY